MPKNTELDLSAQAGAAPDFTEGSIFFVGTATVIIGNREALNRSESAA